MQQTSLRDRLSRSEAFNGYLLVSPPAIYAILILGAPLAAVLVLSFLTDGSGETRIIRELTWSNYQEAWTDPLYQLLLGRSIMVSSLVTLATVLLAFPVAYFVSFHVAPERKSSDSGSRPTPASRSCRRSAPW